MTKFENALTNSILVNKRLSAQQQLHACVHDWLLQAQRDRSLAEGAST